MRKIVVIGSSYIRDSQIYTGDPDDNNISYSDKWEDVKYPNLYLGIGEGKDEDEIKERFAKSLGISKEIIDLYEC